MPHSRRRWKDAWQVQERCGSPRIDQRRWLGWWSWKRGRRGCGVLERRLARTKRCSRSLQRTTVTRALQVVRRRKCDRGLRKAWFLGR